MAIEIVRSLKRPACFPNGRSRDCFRRKFSLVFSEFICTYAGDPYI